MRSARSVKLRIGPLTLHSSLGWQTRAADVAPSGRIEPAAWAVTVALSMIVHGFHAVLARLKRAPHTVKVLYIAGSRDDARVRGLLDTALQVGVKPNLVDATRIDRIAPQRRHQGVVAQVAFAPPVAELDVLLDHLIEQPLLLLLDGVTDPRNLGACLRVADGAGVHAVVAPKDHACALTEVAVQTACGAAEHVPYVMVTNLAHTITDLRERGIWVVGTADDVRPSIYDQTLPAAIAWVLGAEGKGLRRLTRTRCDQLVGIPMVGSVGSLNVSVAAGVVLYETMRQTRLGGQSASPR
jgi:23S rRNA (guanosine2251-2'-O)-methyltransferase